MSVAAAASLEPVSPELALVDAALAAQLRAILSAPIRHVGATPSGGTNREEQAGEVVEYPAVASFPRVDTNDPIADLLARRHDPSTDLFMHETDQQAEVSGYPALPSPADGDSEQTDATEAVLREIRDRLTTPPLAKPRKRFRRSHRSSAA